MFLFKVEQTFNITGRGLVLLPGLGNAKVFVGASIKVVRPDKTIINTQIMGISFNEFRDILVSGDLKKEDVPIGSEIWLNEER